MWIVDVPVHIRAQRRPNMFPLDLADQAEALLARATVQRPGRGRIVWSRAA
jgi:hypothetical protein